MSYIKENSPETYNFYVELWSFVKKYWVVENNEDWWNCFIDDLRSNVNKYDTNDFFVDNLMELYTRNKDSNQLNTSIETAKHFFSDYWNYINEYYECKDNPEYWDKLVSATKEITSKYGEDPYFVGVIDLFFNRQTN